MYTYSSLGTNWEQFFSTQLCSRHSETTAAVLLLDIQPDSVVLVS